MTDSVRMSNVAQNTTTPDNLHFTTKGADMDAYDQLGPACQKALQSATLPWSAEACLWQHRKRGWNPKDPQADQRLAAEFAGIDHSTTITTAGEGHPIRDTP